MNNNQNPDPTYGKDLTPKKVIFQGSIQFGGHISVHVSTFQELATAYTTKGLVDAVIDFFGIQSITGDIADAFQAYMINPKILTVKSRVFCDGEEVGPITIESNGGRYPSCSASFCVPNPLWDEAVDKWTDSWSIGFEFRKGKWHIRHTDKQGGHGNAPYPVYPKTRQQMLDLVEIIRAMKTEC